MKNIKNLLITVSAFIGLAFIVTSCSSAKIYTDYKPGTNFTQYKTFSVLPWQKTNAKVNEFDRERIKNAVITNMQSLGYTYSEQDTTADLQVGMVFTTKEKKSVTSYNAGYGGWYGPWGMGATHYSEYDYTEGTFVVDVFDTQARKLLWEAAAVGTVPEKQENPVVRERNINRFVKSIFNKYPMKN
ncbi:MULTISPECIES: DUF4136 domain-containing protein [Flammeovirga]|uniref:DUF4136 domain-containing protein n=1 Tax=Flammeovirga agarivorans TaxID=2726742 RepID=A0A7X8SMH1_9BACT|nr:MULTISPECIES: DUF4136 domain-containing protein [Flammeovirga]NLR92961.1 DUF4136 domain-containing protein [Flammeovirga agarivorans]